MSKKKNKKKNKNLNKPNKLKNIQAKKIDNNLEEIKKDIENITSKQELKENVQEELQKVDGTKEENKDIEQEKLELVVVNKEEKDKKGNKINIIKIIIKALKIILKLLIGSFIFTLVYSLLSILSIIFLGLSLAGVGIFSIGIVGTMFNITNLITKMGAVACIFVGMGSVCLGIFLMVLCIEGIKMLIKYVKTNFKNLILR